MCELHRRLATGGRMRFQPQQRGATERLPLFCLRRHRAGGRLAQGRVRTGAELLSVARRSEAGPGHGLPEHLQGKHRGSRRARGSSDSGSGVCCTACTRALVANATRHGSCTVTSIAAIGNLFARLPKPAGSRSPTPGPTRPAFAWNVSATPSEGCSSHRNKSDLNAPGGPTGTGRCRARPCANDRGHGRCDQPEMEIAVPCHACGGRTAGLLQAGREPSVGP